MVAHNLETVKRLTPAVRDHRATYRQSLGVLGYVKEVAPHIVTKTSLMLGLGETNEDVRQAIRDIKGVSVDVLTLGQYLRPGRAQAPVGPNSRIFHCVANTVGESPDGLQTSSGQSFIREPNGIPLAEAGYYQEEMITAVLDLARADRSYVLDSMKDPPFLARYWEEMVAEAWARKDITPE